MPQPDAVTWHWRGWCPKTLVSWWQVKPFYLYSIRWCAFTPVITQMYFVPPHKISHQLWVGKLQMADFIQWLYVGPLLRWFCLWRRQIREIESKNDWISAKLLPLGWSNSIKISNNCSADFSTSLFQNHPWAAGLTVVYWSSNSSKYTDVYNSERG